MRIAIVGAGRIGGNCARQARRVGHEVVLTFSRTPERLDALAADLGPGAAVAPPAEAAAVADLVILSVPWDAVDEAATATGDLAGKVVIDTTNQFNRLGPVDLGGGTAAAHNAARLPGARYTKSFNTLTSGFQATVAGRTGEDRVVQWVCGDDDEAKGIVGDLIDEMGYAAVDLGGTATCQVMEAPRRPGAVYGEEYRLPDAAAVVEAVAAGRPIPPTPVYG
jgi:hypothetical protein